MMRLWQTVGVLVALALMALHAPLVHTTPIVGGGLPPRHGSSSTPNGSYRTMRPIRRSLEKRDRPDDFALKTASIHMLFIEELSVGSDKPFVATIEATPYLPTVMLEDLEGPLLQVRCFGHGIGLTFATSALAVQAFQAWGRNGFVVITNHEGCDVDGERVPFTVSDATLHHASSSIVLAAKPAEWEDVTHSHDIQFGVQNTYDGLDMDGYRPSKALLARHGLERRDMTAHLSFNWSHRSLTVNNGGAYIKQVCIQCWSTGTLTLTTGKVKLKHPSDVVVPAGQQLNLFHFADSATISLVSHDVHIRMEMETYVGPGLQASWPLLVEPVPLFGVDFVFLIIGLKWDPQLIAKIQAPSPFVFHYGFDISVPDGSLLSLDLLDPKKSSAAGYHQANFTTLPFRVDNVGTNGFNLSMAFRSIIEFGINIGPKALNPFTVFEDIPQYDASFVFLDGVDDTCQKLNATSTTPADPLDTGAAPASITTPPTGAINVEVNGAINVEASGAINADASKEDLERIYLASQSPALLPDVAAVNYTRTWADFNFTRPSAPESSIVSSTLSIPGPAKSSNATVPPPPATLQLLVATPLSSSFSTSDRTTNSSGFHVQGGPVVIPPAASASSHNPAVPEPIPISPGLPKINIPFHKNHVRIITDWSIDVRIGTSWDMALGYKLGPSLTLSKMVFDVQRYCKSSGPLISDVPGAQAPGSLTPPSTEPTLTSWDGQLITW